MKTIQIIQTVAVLFMAAASTLYAQTTVRVTADSVNLRAKPQLENSEVLAQANYDDHLAARDIGEEWIEVDAPPSVNLWISKEYVQVPENTIGARRVNVRAGPSINYNIVDTLERGTPIEPRDEVSGWLKIAPPPSSRVYIHREFVEILSDPPQAVAAAPAAEPEPRRQRKDKTRKPEDVATAHPVPPAAPVPPPAEIPTPIVSASVPAPDTQSREIPVPPPADLKLIPLEGQGRFAEFEGELRAAPLINEAPTRYRVVRWQSNRWQILCHVYGEASKLRSLQDKRVRVKGREYWIQGAAAPVLVPDQIQETASP